QKMHPEADSQRRNARFHFLNERFGQTKLAQIPDSVTKSADTRKDKFLCRSYVVRVRSHTHIVAQPPQRVFETAQVIQFVINNGDHSTPFVEGIAECST